MRRSLLAILTALAFGGCCTSEAFAEAGGDKAMNSPSESTTVPAVSFKGLPFGVARSTFLDTFSGAQCRAIGGDGFVCNGDSTFSHRTARYSALFSKDRLYLVSLYVADQDEDQVFEDASKELAERFRFPDTADLGRSMVWKPGGEQVVGLMRCSLSEKCLLPRTSAVQVLIGDLQFKQKSDF